MSVLRKEKKSQKRATDRPRIFIVEDEIVIVRGLEEALERLGYTVCGFELTGEAALPAIEAKNPDLVLVDIYLKGEMDGIELARAIISSNEVPVIYITAYSNREILDRAKVTDPFGYIVKPVRERQLKATLEMALERHKTEQKRRSFLESSRETIEELQSQLAARTEELSRTKDMLESANKELLLGKSKLDQLRIELQEVNKALLSLRTHMIRTREELELEVAAALRMKVLPILRQLQVDSGLNKYRIEFDMLSMHMNDLSSGLTGGAICALSAAELRVAALIKNGLSSDQIADLLYVSPETVKTHRRTIRKKLGIQNARTNLSTYLNALWTDTGELRQVLQ